MEVSSWTCFVQIGLMVGCADSEEALNRATAPVLLVMANLLLSLGWKWRSKTAYGSANLWTRVLGDLLMGNLTKNEECSILRITYNALVKGSSFQSCTLPVLLCWISPSAFFVSDRRYVPTMKWCGIFGQNSRQLGGWSKKTVVADLGCCTFSAILVALSA